MSSVGVNPREDVDGIVIFRMPLHVGTHLALSDSGMTLLTRFQFDHSLTQFGVGINPPIVRCGFAIREGEAPGRELSRPAIRPSSVSG